MILFWPLGQWHLGLYSQIWSILLRIRITCWKFLKGVCLCHEIASQSQKAHAGAGVDCWWWSMMPSQKQGNWRKTFTHEMLAHLSIRPQLSWREARKCLSPWSHVKTRRRGHTVLQRPAPCVRWDQDEDWKMTTCLLELWINKSDIRQGDALLQLLASPCVWVCAKEGMTAVMEDAIEALPVMLDVLCIGSPPWGTDVELQIHVSMLEPSLAARADTWSWPCSASMWCRLGSWGMHLWDIGEMMPWGIPAGKPKGKSWRRVFPHPSGELYWCAVLHPLKIPCCLSDGKEHYWNALKMLCHNSLNPKRWMLRSTLWWINDVTKRNKSEYASASPLTCMVELFPAASSQPLYPFYFVLIQICTLYSNIPYSLAL